MHSLTLTILKSKFVALAIFWGVFFEGANDVLASESTDRSIELGRPVRVLITGVSKQLAQETSDLDAGSKIDFSHPSERLSDFDLMVFLVDEFIEVLESELVVELGFGPEDLPEEGKYTYIVVMTVEFENDETLFPIYAINRRNFYARPRECHAPFLRDIILKKDWQKVINSEHHYLERKDC